MEHVEKTPSDLARKHTQQERTSARVGKEAVCSEPCDPVQERVEYVEKVLADLEQHTHPQWAQAAAVHNDQHAECKSEWSMLRRFLPI